MGGCCPIINRFATYFNESEQIIHPYIPVSVQGPIQDIKITDVSFGEKPTITTDIKESMVDETISNHAAHIIIKLNKNKADIFNGNDKVKVNSLIREYITQNKIKKDIYTQIIETIITSLSELI